MSYYTIVLQISLCVVHIVFLTLSCLPEVELDKLFYEKQSLVWLAVTEFFSNIN